MTHLQDAAKKLSAGLIFECVRMWNDILEEGLEDWSDDKYAPYGMPLFEATAKKYGFDLKKGQQ